MPSFWQLGLVRGLFVHPGGQTNITNIAFNSPLLPWPDPVHDNANSLHGLRCNHPG